MRCGYCQSEIDRAAARHQCQGCIVSGGCKSVRCPRCGYEMPEELELDFIKRIASWIKSMKNGRTAHVEPNDDKQGSGLERSLDSLRPGESAVVVKLLTGEPRVLHKLLALGIAPGTELTLERRSPSFIYRIGMSRFASDRELAAAVMVRGPLRV